MTLKLLASGFARLTDSVNQIFTQAVNPMLRYIDRYFYKERRGIRGEALYHTLGRAIDHGNWGDEPTGSWPIVKQNPAWMWIGA